MRRVLRHAQAFLPLAVMLAFAGCDSASPVEQLPPPTITVTAATHTLVQGSTLQLAASVTEADGSASTRKPAWSTSDPAVATVNGSGLVSGVGEGAATLTAALGGSTATYEVVVMRAPPASGPTSTYLQYVSTPGDWVGQGQTAYYNLGAGSWQAVADHGGNHVRVTFDAGGVWWTAEFAAPKGQRLKVGTYEAATRYPFQADAVPGLSFYGTGRGCNVVTGRFVIQDIAIDYEGQVRRLHASFRQYCEGGSTYLDGDVAIFQFPLR
ncbi:MAG TPA: Ig-like domain-containing protein [Longimicrobiaceae bacterium]|nr:Ig-like domain-containing protein [Longimicrobiaceae bacterium]